MEATQENKETLQLAIDNLLSQIEVMYNESKKTGHWTDENSKQEESLVAMMSIIADERNRIEYELSLNEDYGQAYLRTQI